jgi:hypothetical protein
VTCRQEPLTLKGFAGKLGSSAVTAWPRLKAEEVAASCAQLLGTPAETLWTIP